MNDDKNSSLELKKRSNQNRKRRLDLRCSVQMLESVVLVKNIKSGKVTLIRVCVPKSQIHIWLFCFTRPCSVFKTRGLFVVGLTRLIEVIKKYKIVDNQTARTSPISALFSCGFAHRSQTTAREILGKCLELGEARKSYAGNFFAFDFIYSTLLLYELPLCVSFCFADYYKFIRQFIN